MHNRISEINAAVITLEKKLSHLTEKELDPAEIQSEIKKLLVFKDDDGNSILFYAATLNCPSVLKQLIKQGASIEERNNYGRTPLLEVAYRGEDTKAAQFLMDEDADPHAVDHVNRSTLYLAVLNNNTDLVKLFLDKSVDIDKRPDSKNHPLWISRTRNLKIQELLLKQWTKNKGITYNGEMTISQFQKHFKSKIIRKGPLKKLENPSKPSTVDAIESKVYFEDDKVRDLLEGQFKSIYEDAKELAPLMDVMALNALGHHESGRFSDKDFKIIVAGPNTLQCLKVDANKEASGFFSKQFTAFANTGKPGTPLATVLGTMIHESTHFVMHQVFQNEVKPYLEDDEEASTKFKAIVECIQKKVDDFPINDNTSFIAHTLIKSVFIHYDKDQYESELIVKVPEILAELGANAGATWLRKNVPDLYKYYLEHVNPELRSYLKRNAASEKIISLDVGGLQAKPDDFIAIQVAMEKKDYVVLQKILQREERKTTELDFAIDFAIKHCDQGALQAILKMPGIQTKNACTYAFKVAALSNNANMLKYVLENFKEIIGPDFINNTIIEIAKNGCTHSLKTILNDEKQITDVNILGEALISAISNGNVEIAYLLWPHVEGQLSTKMLFEIWKQSYIRFSLFLELFYKIQKEINKTRQLEMTSTDPYFHKLMNLNDRNLHLISGNDIQEKINRISDIADLEKLRAYFFTGILLGQITKKDAFISKVLHPLDIAIEGKSIASSLPWNERKTFEDKINDEKLIPLNSLWYFDIGKKGTGFADIIGFIDAQKNMTLVDWRVVSKKFDELSKTLNELIDDFNKKINNDPLSIKYQLEIYLLEYRLDICKKVLENVHSKIADHKIDQHAILNENKMKNESEDASKESKNASEDTTPDTTEDASVDTIADPNDDAIEDISALFQVEELPGLSNGQNLLPTCTDDEQHTSVTSVLEGPHKENNMGPGSSPKPEHAPGSTSQPKFLSQSDLWKRNDELNTSRHKGKNNNKDFSNKIAKIEAALGYQLDMLDNAPAHDAPLALDVLSIKYDPDEEKLFYQLGEEQGSIDLSRQSEYAALFSRWTGPKDFGLKDNQDKILEFFRNNGPHCAVPIWKAHEIQDESCTVSSQLGQQFYVQKDKFLTDDESQTTFVAMLKGFKAVHGTSVMPKITTTKESKDDWQAAWNKVYGQHIVPRFHLVDALPDQAAATEGAPTYRR